MGKIVQIGQFTVTIREKIGEGGYAIVYRCEDAQGRSYALKTVTCMESSRFEQFQQEANLLRTLPENPHLIRVFAADIDRSNLTVRFLFEFCPMTAMDILMERPLTREEVLVFFHAIVDAVDVLHAQNPPIIHRDLKPENLLVSTDGIPRLCDFGSATTRMYALTSEKEINQARDDVEANTTMSYRAPEMIDLYKRIGIGTKADIWALGCTLYKLILRDDMFPPEARLAILQGKLRLSPCIDSDLVDIIKNCMQLNPDDRPTAADLVGQILSLRGTTDRIFGKRLERGSRAPASDKSSMAIPKPADEVTWAREVKSRYHAWFSSGLQKWVAKATVSSYDAPKEKHIRRVALVAIRQPEMGLHVPNLLLDRPWSTDVRIAAKMMYLWSILLQYTDDLSGWVGLAPPVVQVLRVFQKGGENRVNDQKHIWGEMVCSLCALVRRKLLIHKVVPGLAGNMAFSAQARGGKDVENLRRYLVHCTDMAEEVIRIVNRTNLFAMAVFSQPFIEELANVLILGRYLDPNAISAEVPRAMDILNEAQAIPYIDSSVEFPNSGAATKPRMRFADSL
jgi:serine/threonine protein kinase